ncbi:MAG: DUF2497 domain-containing protein [Mesorhizobium sp.]
MAQSSAQRDPSMEEILASIRKIIEEGEEARQKPADLRDDFDVTPIGPAANDATRRPLAPAPELRTVIPQVVPAEDKVVVSEKKPDIVEVKDLDEAVAAAEAAINELSLSLDDFAIDIDEVHDAAASEQESLVDTIEDAPKLHASDDAQMMPAGDAPEVAATDTVAVAREKKIFVSPPMQAPKVVASSVVVDSVKPNRPLVAGISSVVGTPPADQKNVMLSQAVERQVAASFTELSEALAASRRRPLDQIAEEMMRPMLQEWLDNNLPTLVERLVREEIERVARGAA